MNDKPARPAFQPAPRPRPINDAGSTEALRKATEDLGFNRTTSSAPAGEPIEPAVAAVARLQPVSPAPRPKVVEEPPPPRAAAKTKAEKSAPALDFSDRETSLKFVIDDALSTALKLDAVKRRVTVKYLVLEALAEKGYPVDLANLPEDGRRVRKIGDG